MKNCKTCNAALEDEAIFCVMCGAKADDGTQDNLAPPVPSNIDYAAVLTGDSSKDSPRQVFFNATSSSKALLAVILLTITFLFSVATVVMSLLVMSGVENSNEMLAILMAEGGIDPVLAENFVKGFTTSLTVIIAVMLVPAALTVVGIILTYINSKKRSLSTMGLSFLKATVVFTLVYYALIFLLLVIASLAVPYGVVVAVIAGALGFAIPIVIQIFMLTAINNMKRVVVADHSLTIPTFVPIVVILATSISAIVGITSGDILSMIIGVVGTVGNILFAICMFDYNNALALMRVKNIYDKPVDRGNGL